MGQTSFPDMFRAFGRIGLLSFGGPAAQIALMHKELVEDRNWLSERDFLSALSFCMLLPGPEAMQLATYSGWRLRGWLGGLLAGVLFVSPGAVLITALVLAYVQFGDLPLVQAMFLGVKATVVVIVIQALRKLSAKALKSPAYWVIAALAFFAIFGFGLPFPLILILAAIAGVFLAEQSMPTEAAPISGSARQTLLTVVFWGAIWLGPLLLLWASGATFLTDIAVFFAKLAVVTFGGAYAVLAYLAQAVVQDHNWITAPEMIDALGLAETTPGPLILVTQFVAMLAGHHQGGVGLAMAAGIVALWMTFAPCFLWIFAGAPWIAALTHRPRISAALSAITAAVVGVILNLTLWFAMHVWFAQVTQVQTSLLTLTYPSLDSISITAVLLSVLAAVLMMGLRLGLAATLLIVAGVAGALALL